MVEVDKMTKGLDRRGLIGEQTKSCVICARCSVLIALELAFDSIWADLTEEVMRFAEANLVEFVAREYERGNHLVDGRPGLILGDQHLRR